MKILFELDSPHGFIVGASLGGDPWEAGLFPEEIAIAEGYTGARRDAFAAGRRALRRAFERVGAPLGPIPRDDRNAPKLPKHLSGSISHKDDLAVAIARAIGEEAWSVGVDLERHRVMAVDISRRVLTERELAASEGMGDRRGAWLLARFSLKEAIYKAIDPFVRRYVGFREVELHPLASDGLDEDLEVRGPEGPSDPKLVVVARRVEVASESDLVVSTALARLTP